MSHGRLLFCLFASSPSWFQPPTRGLTTRHLFNEQLFSRRSKRALSTWYGPPVIPDRDVTWAKSEELPCEVKAYVDLVLKDPKSQVNDPAVPDFIERDAGLHFYILLLIFYMLYNVIYYIICVCYLSYPCVCYLSYPCVACSLAVGSLFRCGPLRPSDAPLRRGRARRARALRSNLVHAPVPEPLASKPFAARKAPVELDKGPKGLRL